MVATRSARSSIAPDQNRIIAVVTGANSGFGLGICQQLLTNLSLPSDEPIPVSVPQASALAPSQRHLLDSPRSTKHISSSSPPILTLVLACRSGSRAEEARRVLLEGHELELEARVRQGMPVRRGWREGLKIIWEAVDLDSLSGPHGVIQFCARMSDTYPHITSLYLNAGMAVYKGNNYWKFVVQMLSEGLLAPLTEPTFNIEHIGVKSADGERGKCWGVNCLAPYIMAKELLPLMKRSPRSLPFPPRVIYVSSATARLSALHQNPLDDYQLLSYGSSYTDSVYKASKYCGDLCMVQLDRQFAKDASTGEAEVRVMTTDPGMACTNIFDSGFGNVRVYLWFMKWLNWASFWFARLIGSPNHTIYATESALAMLYAALIDSQFIQSADKVPAPRFKVHASRWGNTTIDYAEVDRWEESLEIGEGMVRACEAMRIEARRKEGLE